MRPAPLLDCSEKSPRQLTRAGTASLITRMDKGDGADGALIERRRQSGDGRLAEP